MQASKCAGSALISLILALAATPLVAQPADGPGTPGMMYPGMMGPQMMGPGGMGPGMMGRAMMGYGAPPPPATSSSGKAIFQSQCALCHTLRAGAPNGAGPNLHGLFGRKSGSMPDYPYSAAMRDAGVVWNEHTLDTFLAAPQAFVADITMPYPGLPDAKLRQRLIAYLKTATK